MRRGVTQQRVVTRTQIIGSSQGPVPLPVVVFAPGVWEHVVLPVRVRALLEQEMTRQEAASFAICGDIQQRSKSFTVASRACWSVSPP